MTSEDLSIRLQKAPFHPMRVFLTDGAHYDVHHPELLMVGRRSATIGVTKVPGKKVYDYMVEVDLMHIVRIEPLEVQNVSSGGGNGTAS
jgi:hypothetical protein